MGMIKELDSKAKFIVWLIKFFILIIIILTYMIFFRIWKMIINYTVAPYNNKIVEITSQEKNMLGKINQLKNKNKNKKMIEQIHLIWKIQKDIWEKQGKIISETKKMLDNDLLAYWYICNRLWKYVETNDKEINIEDFSGAMHNILLKKRVKDTILKYNDFRNKYINFYKTSCNQDWWFKRIISKYFIKNDK